MSCKCQGQKSKNSRFSIKIAPLRECQYKYYLFIAQSLLNLQTYWLVLFKFCKKAVSTVLNYIISKDEKFNFFDANAFRYNINTIEL